MTSARDDERGERRVFNVAPEGVTSIEVDQSSHSESARPTPIDLEQIIKSSSPDEVIFLTHILSLKTAALIHLGVIKEAGEEMDLETAQQIIETLIVLEKRTQGHLGFEERQLLETAIQELKQAYLHAQRL